MVVTLEAPLTITASSFWPSYEVPEANMLGIEMNGMKGLSVLAPLMLIAITFIIQ